MKQWLIGLLLVFGLACTAFSQTTGKIAGAVKDADSGEPLIGVNIVLEGTTLGAASDLNGQFFILNVPPGGYTVKFMSMGYQTKVYQDVRVNVNRTVTLNVELNETSLDLGEEVVVTADRVTVRKDQTSSIRNVSAEDMEILPIENTGGVVSLQPGVVQGHFRGGRSNETAYMIDGISVNNGLNRRQMVSIDPDAVEEVEVITGTFSAKYGEAMSGVVNMVTKEGGNQYHGKLEGYLGNYYSGHDDVYLGIDPADVSRNRDFKYMAHGPIFRDKLTFFLSGRVQSNNNYLYGIRRFAQTDAPDYSQFQDSTRFNLTTGEYLLSQHSGDGDLVPMDWYDEFNINGKLTYKLQNVKMSLMYLYNQSENQNYSHVNKYKPDGRATNNSNSSMFTFRVNHILTQKMFYELKLSYSNSVTSG